MASQLDFPTTTTYRDPSQNNLFEPEPKARQTDPDTSHEAAKAAAPTAANQRTKILQVLIVQGPMTGDALDEFFGWPHATANRRLPELRDMDPPAVRMLDKCELTRSGRNARLWEAVK